MKRLLFIVLFSAFLNVNAQKETEYGDLLKQAHEIGLADSLHIDATPSHIHLLDSSIVKKWFSPLLGLAKNNRLKNRNYYLAGKITSHENFDLLVLLEEKKKVDSSNVQVVYLVSSKKDGNYIASIEAAVSGIKKKSNYNISSWLYKDYKIVLDSKILVNDQSFDDMTSYRINRVGRFILAGRFE